MAAGADLILTKPCLPEELAVQLRTVLAHSSDVRNRARALRSDILDRLARADEVLSRAVDTVHRRHTLKKAHHRGDTTNPPITPPRLVCPSCDRPLAYRRSHIGGVSSKHTEQWDYFECESGCGTYQVPRSYRGNCGKSADPAVGTAPILNHPGNGQKTRRKCYPDDFMDDVSLGGASLADPAADQPPSDATLLVAVPDPVAVPVPVDVPVLVDVPVEAPAAVAEPIVPQASAWRRAGQEIVAAAQTLLSAAVYATLIVTFCVQVARVDGLSMAPTLDDQDRLIVNKLVYQFGDPQPGDIVMLYYPVDPDKMFVKRVIAQEGDTVRIVDGRVYVNELPLADDYVPVGIPQPRRPRSDGRAAGLLLRDGRPSEQQPRQPPLGTGAEEVHRRQSERALVADSGRQTVLMLLPQLVLLNLS